MTAVELPRPSFPKPLPPLQNGDRLTADEFERRFDAMPELQKAELLDGVVYLPPPVCDEDHGEPHLDLATWLGTYRAATPGVTGGIESTLRLDPQNRPQPDAFLRIRPEFGGRVRRDQHGYLVAAPDLVVEVAASSASYDLTVKREMYRRNGTREYVVWRVYDATVDWFILRGDRYESLGAEQDGVFRSEAFPGLWLDGPALMRGDFSRVLQVGQQGLASPEHAAFVERLKQAAAAQLRQWGGQSRAHRPFAHLTVSHYIS